MLWPGWRRSGPNKRPRLLLRMHLRREDFIERSGQKRNLAARSVREDRDATERSGGRNPGYARDRVPIFADPAWRAWAVQTLDLAWPSRRISRGPDPAGQVSQSHLECMGW